jgi:hypothetical protein
MDYNNQPENSADLYYLSNKGPNYSLSPHFNLLEFASIDFASIGDIGC